MSTLDLSIPHTLTTDEAVTRIKSLLGKLREEHGEKISDLKESWSERQCEFSFQAMGFDVSGTMTVTSRDVHLVGKLPFAASLFKDKIKNAILEQARQQLS